MIDLKDRFARGFRISIQLLNKELREGASGTQSSKFTVVIRKIRKGNSRDVISG